MPAQHRQDITPNLTLTDPGLNDLKDMMHHKRDRGLHAVCNAWECAWEAHLRLTGS